MLRMIIQCRWLFNDLGNIGNRDKDLCSPIGQGLCNGKLVQIPRIIIVDGTPDKVSEIKRRFHHTRRRPVDFVEFGDRLDRKIRNQSSFQHCPAGNSLQDRAVLSCVGIRHPCLFLEYPVVRRFLHCLFFRRLGYVLLGCSGREGAPAHASRFGLEGAAGNNEVEVSVASVSLALTSLGKFARLDISTGSSEQGFVFMTPSPSAGVTFVPRSP